MLNFYEILSLFLEDLITYTISAYIYIYTYLYIYLCQYVKGTSSQSFYIPSATCVLLEENKYLSTSDFQLHSCMWTVCEYGLIICAINFLCTVALKVLLVLYQETSDMK